MTAYTGPDGEPTLTDLEKEFGWICWNAADGQCYARRPTTPGNDHDARGEDPLDLRDAIRLALSVEAEAAWQAEHYRTDPRSR
jgi:hypothetical protein